ncbi:hypothetical protein C8Q74DRAFT_1204585 [Fomes fomentarius]|nr:hypothetical protein C8Q74DRAFT_1204585 [Fomes fomentarius]
MERPPSYHAPNSCLTLQNPVNLRSSEFFYPDGNVVIKVQDVYFKLFRSRLTRHCLYFNTRLERNPDSGPRQEVFDGCWVYTMSELAVLEFETFLRFLEFPMENSVQDAPTEVAESLLRTSRLLECTLMSDLAKKRLLTAWSLTSPPTKGNPSPSYQDAITILPIARELQNRDVLKLALYELLASDTFWKDVSGAERSKVDVADADLIRLLTARAALQESWRTHVLSPPKACNTASCSGSHPALCNSTWFAEFAQSIISETRDPFREIDVFQDRVRALKGRWCDACIGDRVRAWDDVRLVWWKELGAMLAV